MKYEVHEQATPSAQVIGDAVKEVTVTDRRGRVIVARRAGVLAQFKLVEALGPETSMNGRYVAMASRLNYLVSIDGVPITLRNKQQIEGVIQLLDDDGFEALGEAIETHWPARDPEGAREQLKK